MPTKSSLTSQWEADHPDDEPCPEPRNGLAAHAWRLRRGIGGSAQWARDKAALRARQRRPEITPELLFGFYKDEFESALARLKEKYSRPDLLPAVLEIIQAQHNKKSVAFHVRQGIRGGIFNFIRSAIDAAEEPERKALEKARKAAMTAAERRCEAAMVVTLKGAP